MIMFLAQGPVTPPPPAQNNFGDTLGDGVAGPTALLIIVLLGVGTALLIRNMNGHLRRLPTRFPVAAGGAGVSGAPAGGQAAGAPAGGSAAADSPAAGAPPVVRDPGVRDPGGRADPGPGTAAGPPAVPTQATGGSTSDDAASDESRPE